MTRGHLDAAVLRVAYREPSLILRRRPEPQYLLDRSRDFLRILKHFSPLIWVAVEQHNCVADELRDRLSAGAAEQTGESSDLLVVELRHLSIATVDFHLRQPAEHVVIGVLAFVLHELREVRRHLELRVHPFGSRRHLPGLTMQTDVEPMPDLLSLAFRYAEHARDDLDREWAAEVCDSVELVSVVV